MFGLGRKKPAAATTDPVIETDLVVVGTGAAGLVGALAAHEAGLKVTLLEKTNRVGGTTAVSGGVVWVPGNHHMAAAGVTDSREEALRYVTRLTDGRSSARQVEAFLDGAPEMLRFVERSTELRFTALARYPDYHPEFDGGKPGARSLDPGLFDANLLGPWKDKLRRSPVFGMTAMSVTEATDWGVFAKPMSLPFQLLGERYAKGLVCYGAALVGRLLQALLARGIEPVLQARAKQILVENDASGGRVTGLRASVVAPGATDGASKDVVYHARRGVLLASGGFEWDPELCARFLGGPLTHPNSPPGNTGDGLRMAMSVGADLGNMSEAWWCPSLSIPGEQYDGKPLHRGDFATRSQPHSILVNRQGRRFVNEAANYNDLGKAFATFDPGGYDRPNLPAWLILDGQHVGKYMVMTFIPGRPLPEFIPRADTLGGSAAKVGIDPAGLAATVDRFNGFARDGVDRDYQRGTSTYDRFYGDPTTTSERPNANLGTIEKGPFFALQVHPGAIGTKGGPRVDERARVLRASDGEPVPGLWAAGNVMAGVTGAGYPGAGSTIAAAMTFGWLAGNDAAAASTIAQPVAQSGATNRSR